MYEIKNLKIKYFTLTKHEDRFKKIVMKAPPKWNIDDIKNSLVTERRKVKEVVPLKTKKEASHTRIS